MNERTPDIMPSVSMSLGYGEYVESFDVDIVGIVDYLRDKGIPDDEIENLQINFVEKDGNEGDWMKYAAYMGSTDTIEMLSLNALQKAHLTAHSLHSEEAAIELSQHLVHELEHKIATKNEELQQREKAFYRKIKEMVLVRGLGAIGLGAGAGMGTVAVLQANELLVHPDVYGFSPLQVIACLAVAKGVMMGAEKVWPLPSEEYKYVNDPEEIHVRKIAETTDKKFVSFHPKPIDRTTVDQIDFRIRLLRTLRDELENLSDLPRTTVSHQA